MFQLESASFEEEPIRGNSQCNCNLDQYAMSLCNYNFSQVSPTQYVEVLKSSP